MDATVCRAVIFDLGDVLYDASQWRRWLYAQLVGRGCQLHWSEMVAAWESHLESVYRGGLAYEAALDTFLSSWLPEREERAAFLRACLLEKAAIESRREPHPEAGKTLARLRAAGIRLAVLTDSESPAAAIWELLDGLGLAGAMDAVVSSCDVGQAKPAQAAYRAALEALGVEASRALFVGHDQDELDGAAATGLQTRSLETTGPTRGHRRLARLADLQELVP